MAVWKSLLLIDGENIDMTLGSAILHDRPAPDQRPRWERLVHFVERTWGGPVLPLFFLNVSHNTPYSFIAALHAMGFKAVPLKGPEDVKVVDVGIIKTLEYIKNATGNVVLGSHDADFVQSLSSLIDGQRRVAVVGFTEMLAAELRAMPGLEIFDLEYDVHAFNMPLPRLQAIDVDDFDPSMFVD